MPRAAAGGPGRGRRESKGGPRLRRLAGRNHSSGASGGAQQYGKGQRRASPRPSRDRTVTVPSLGWLATPPPPRPFNTLSAVLPHSSASTPFFPAAAAYESDGREEPPPDTLHSFRGTFAKERESGWVGGVDGPLGNPAPHSPQHGGPAASGVVGIRTSAPKPGGSAQFQVRAAMPACRTPSAYGVAGTGDGRCQAPGHAVCAPPVPLCPLIPSETPPTRRFTNAAHHKLQPTYLEIPIRDPLALPLYLPPAPSLPLPQSRP